MAFRRWVGTNSDFSLGNNWLDENNQPGTPRSGDIININPFDGTYTATVTVVGALSTTGSGQLTVENDATLTVDGLFTIAGNGSGLSQVRDGAILNLNGGLTVDGPTFNTGLHVSGGIGHVLATTKTKDQTAVVIGDHAKGALTVTSEGLFDASESEVTLGKEQNSSGSLSIGTPGTAATPEVRAETLNVGVNGTGTVGVRNNGFLHVLKDMIVAQENTSSGSISVGVAGTSSGHIDVDGNIIAGQHGQATISAFATGTLLEAQNLTLGGAVAHLNACHEWEYAADPGSGTLSVSDSAVVRIAEKVLLKHLTTGTDTISVIGGMVDVGGGGGASPGKMYINSEGEVSGHGSIFVRESFGGLIGTVVINGGVLAAKEGYLSINAKVDSTTGTTRIDDDATLNLLHRFDGTVTFNDTTDPPTYHTMLRLAGSELYDPVQPGPVLTGLKFTGAVADLSRGDTIVVVSGTWSGLGAGDHTIGHTENDGSEFIITTRDHYTVSYTLDQEYAFNVFSIRKLPTLEIGVTFEAESPQVVTGSMAVPGHGYPYPFVDSLISGWAKWDKGQGPIKYCFGDAAKIADAISVHGETYYVRCDAPGNVQTWTDAEKAAYEAALDVYESVCGLAFEKVESASDANIVAWKVPNIVGAVELLGETEPLAHRPDGHVWQYFEAPEATSFGSEGRRLFTHELGHALGLAHPHGDGPESDDSAFPTVGGATDPGSNFQNQPVYTVMSYVNPGGWIADPATTTFGDQGGLGAFDIAALQTLYDEAQYNFGNDLYILPTTNGSGTGWSCIWDKDGIEDTIGAPADVTADCTIDLRAATLNLNDHDASGQGAGGFVSYIHGIKGGFTIAHNAHIENAYGAQGNDTLIGNDDNNTLTGFGGNNTLNGGGGTDTADYSLAPGSVNINLTLGGGFNGYGNNIDSLTNIENVTGSQFNDSLAGNNDANTLIGNAGDDELSGGGGDDVFEGGAGADRINGDGGSDTISYGRSGAGVSVSLGAAASLIGPGGPLAAPAAFGSGGDAEGDQLTGIENLMGSDFADVLTGEAGANTLDGGGGADTLYGLSGADVIIGGSGNDTINGGDQGDVIFGGDDDDSIGGGMGLDTIDGGSGNDTILGALGADAIFGNLGFDEIHGGDGNDTINGGDQGDVITGDTGDDVIGGGMGLDTIDGGIGNDTITGGMGNDQLTGGADADTFAFGSPGVANDGVDTIVDFVSGSDTIQVSAAGYGGGLTAGGSPTVLNVADHTTVASGGGQFIFQTGDSTLWFDATGGSGADAVEIVVLIGVASLQATDFHVV